MGMELHSSPPPPPPPPPTTTGKKLWNILRIAFLMTRKGFTSKRKLIMDMNLMMQRGKLRLGKGFAGNNLTNSSNARDAAAAAFGLHEYEFSCTNSPNPTKRKHGYFPCMGGGSVVDEDQPVDTAPGPATSVSPFSARASNCSLAEEGDDGEVDNRAEEFIRKFYQQLDNSGTYSTASVSVVIM